MKLGSARQRWTAYHADAIEPRLFVVRQIPLAGWRLATTLALVRIVLGLLPVSFILAMSVLIGRVPAAVRHGLDSAAWNGLLTAFIVASVAFISQQLLAPLATALGEVVKHRVDGRFRDRLLEISFRTVGIAAMEDQAVLDRLNQASEQLETGFRTTPGGAVTGTLAYLERYTQLAGYLVVLGLVSSWPASLALFACVMCFRYGHRSGLRMWTRLWPAVSADRRKSEYFRDVGLYAPAAKELRVFGLTDWIIGRYRASALAALQPIWDTRRRILHRRFLWFTGVGLLVASVVLALLTRSAAAGEITLTELILGLQCTIAAILLGSYYQDIDDKVQFGMVAARAVDDLDRLMTMHARNDVAVGGGGDAAGMPVREIRFADVSFTYQGRTEPVLDGLELTLHADQCTAIVGLNGAGKTTIIKLLARLYEPTGGAVLVDGTDVRDLGVDSWRRQIGVIFQDFNRYELSAADNIAFGSVERPRDLAAVRSAASRAGIAPVLDALPHGMDTPLSRHYKDGAELSGGQWQRLVIARALYAVDAGARVLVLDEPTSALDVRAEAAFYDRFVQATRGVTTLLISHRLGTVRRADRIVVLDGGRVVEDGTHDSLLAAGGRYAQLFQLQMERFADGLEADDSLDGVTG